MKVHFPSITGRLQDADPERGAAERGYLMMEALFYIGLVGLVLGIGYAAVYRAIDSAIALKQSAADISRALTTGEQWRADVRASRQPPRVEADGEGKRFVLEGSAGEVVYAVADQVLWRKNGNGPWVHLIENIKASEFVMDSRKDSAAWRWDLELEPKTKGRVRPGRVMPIFTFLAVPVGRANVNAPVNR
jgi:hypothetical protein